LKPKLVEEQAKQPRSRVLDGQITGAAGDRRRPEGPPAAA